MAGWLGGCAPTLDWREVAMPGTPLRAELPCRPGRFEREVVVAGSRLRMFLLSCEAGGVTFGVASAEVGDPARVEGVLAGLAEAAGHGLRGAHGEFVAWTLRGATPFRGTVKARFAGARPDGVGVEESVRLFARGTRIYQATAIGPALPDAAVAPFEDGLRFDLETREAGPN